MKVAFKPKVGEEMIINLNKIKFQRGFEIILKVWYRLGLPWGNFKRLMLKNKKTESQTHPKPVFKNGWQILQTSQLDMSS